MSTDDGFVTQVVGALSRALTPLVGATSSPEALAELLARLGWEANPTADAVSTLARANPALDALAADVAADAPDAALVADVAAAMAALAELEDVSLAGAGAPFDDPAFWRALPGELFALLVSEDLETNKPRLYGVLRFLGVLKVEARPADAGTGRLAYDARVIDVGAAARAAAAPERWLADAYGWGASLDHGPFLDALAALGAGLGGSTSRQAPHPDLAGRYVAPDNPDRGTVGLLCVSPFEVEGPTLEALVKPALLVLPLPPAGEPSAPPEGLLLWPIVSGAAAATVDLGPAAELVLDGDFQATPLRIQLRPGGAVVEDATADAAAAVRVDIAPATPFVMAGAAGGTRIELTRAHFGIGVQGSGAGAEVVIDAALDEASAVLDLAGADSFLRGVLGSAEESLSIATGLEWSNASGLTFSGSPRLSVTIPTSLRFAGVLSVEAITVEIAAAEGDAVELTVAVVGSFELGPFRAVAEQLGLRITAAPATFDAPGNFGLLDVSLGFKPPTRLSFTITSEAVNGGGFVEFFPDTGRYAGGLALDIFGFGLSAIVIVDTAIPGDPDGWALFGSLGLEFATPIPLGFGFTLIGVGGLLALNRTLDPGGLAADLRTGAADSILFPDDLEEDADAVLAGLDTWFPTMDGSTVFGPVVQIGWGSPTIVTAQLGVVVALPDLIVALLGSVEVLLPTPDAPLLSLRMDVLGAVDIPAGTVIVAASLHDSNLLGIFELSGDMGFYLALSGQPLFVLSIGGYHPQFDPPGALPAWLLDLRRTRAAVDLGENVEVVLTSYVAVTSNTLQFGGKFRLEASVEVLLTTYSAEGWFTINVLLVLKPFKLVARATAGVSISAGDKELLGVDLSTRLEGPEPWYATGHATFTFFGFDVDFGFEIGAQAGGEPREIHDVATDVVSALAAPGAWQTAEPGDAWAGGVVMSDERPEGLWVRPDQSVELRQSVAPLNRTMTAYGEFTPAVDVIEAEAVTLAGDAVSAPEWLDDWFAPAQFDRLADGERLSSPSYELMTAGVRFGDDGVGITSDFTGECTSVSREPEESIFPDEHPKPSGHVCTARPAALASTTRSLANDRVAVLATTYTVVRVADGARADAVLSRTGTGPALSYAEACAVLAGQPAADRSRLRVAPSHAAGERVAA
jgi:hypothetical protein